MKHIWVAAVALMIGTLSLPAHAAPPTVTPSPGYDARLQESRQGSRQGSATTIYTPAPRPPKTKPKKPPHQ